MLRKPSDSPGPSSAKRRRQTRLHSLADRRNLQTLVSTMQLAAKSMAGCGPTHDGTAVGPGRDRCRHSHRHSVLRKLGADRLMLLD